MEEQTDEVLVLTDEDGVYYAVPREILERYRVSDEQKGELDALLGDEVVGYLMQNTSMTDQLARTYHAEKIEQGAAERMARAARRPDDGSADSAGAFPAARRGSLIGRFVRLSRARQPRSVEGGA
jgi:hypothetical protein